MLTFISFNLVQLLICSELDQNKYALLMGLIRLSGDLRIFSICHLIMNLDISSGYDLGYFGCEFGTSCLTGHFLSVALTHQINGFFSDFQCHFSFPLLG